MDTLNNIEEMASTYLEKNGWNEWAKYVLMSLEELKTSYASSEEQIQKLQISVIEQLGALTTEIKIIKTKSTQRAALTAVIIAFLPTLGMVLYNIFK